MVLIRTRWKSGWVERNRDLALKVLIGLCKFCFVLFQKKEKTSSERIESSREMFFFFFGGVTQEVRNVLEKGFAVCPRCGGSSDLVEYDNVFRAFFIPLWRWSGDNPAIACETCGFLMPVSRTLQEASLKSFKLPPATSRRRQHDWTPTAPMILCWSCSSPVDPSFRFCPQCGSPQN